MVVLGKSYSKNEIDIYIHEQVKSARKEMGLNQSDFSKLVGMTRPALSNRELGRTPFNASELVIIAEVTGKPIEWFFPNGEKE